MEPWHEPVLHRFDETHTRWVPFVPPPLWRASDENVITMATARGIGTTTIPLLVEFGHLSLPPTTSGSAEPAAMAMEAVAMATDPPEHPLPPLLESPVLKDDNILMDDDQSMPAPAEMVE